MNPPGPRDDRLSKWCVVCLWSPTPQWELQGKLKWVTSHRAWSPAVARGGGEGSRVVLPSCPCKSGVSTDAGAGRKCAHGSGRISVPAGRPSPLGWPSIRRPGPVSPKRTVVPSDAAGFFLAGRRSAEKAWLGCTLPRAGRFRRLSEGLLLV